MKSEPSSVAVEAAIREAMARGDHHAAATHVIRAYGPRILRYLFSVLRDEHVAHDTFSTFCEFLWKGLHGFDGRSSALTWCYRLAWGAVRRTMREPHRRRGRRLETAEVSALVEQVRSGTAAYLRTENKQGVQRLREHLDGEEQTLLYLRIDQKLTWQEVAAILEVEGAKVEPAALRKRYERIKDKMRALARAEGLLGGD